MEPRNPNRASDTLTRYLPLIGLFALAACDIPPAVSDFNGSSVKIQTSAFNANAPQLASAEAARICQKVGKRAEYASTRQISDYDLELLFLCL